jgi:hypothetical protein
MAQRLFWPCWVLASVTTGLVAGFMLGHALSYPTFANSAGRGGLMAFHALCSLQVVAALALLAQALGLRRHRLGAGIAATAAVLWPALHYGSGFAAVEAAALRSVTPISADVATAFLAWNSRVHTAHTVLLVVGLTALLTIPAVIHRPWRRAPADDSGRGR